MPVRHRVQSAVRFCFGSNRRRALSLLILLAAAGSCWYAGRVILSNRARADAEQALARYDFSAARGYLAIAVQYRPRNPSLWLLAAQAARRDGDLAEAKKCLVRYETLVGDATQEGALEWSLLFAQQGEIEREVQDLMWKADAGHPATEQILEALAVGSIHIYDFDRAGFWVHHLLTRFPRNPIGRVIRAQMDDVLGKRDQAAVRCSELLQDHPDNWKARVLLAGLLYRAQQYAEASKHYLILHDRRPEELIPVLGLIRCRERIGQFEEARPLVQLLERNFSTNPDAMLECGRFALSENRFTDAERFLRKAVALAPNDHEIHYQLGLLFERTARPAEAREHLERFKSIETDLTRLDELLKEVVKNPRDPGPRREAGLICLRNGQASEGLRWLLGAVEINPADKASHRALAEYYLSQGDLARSNLHSQQSR